MSVLTKQFGLSIGVHGKILQMMGQRRLKGRWSSKYFLYDLRCGLSSGVHCKILLIIRQRLKDLNKANLPNKFKLNLTPLIPSIFLT